MAKIGNRLHIRSKVWIENDRREVVLGLGRLRILEAIQRHGSLTGAARELKMGYRAIWARIRATEERLGASLLVTSAGGSAGGGSRLTPLAEELVTRLRQLQKEVERQTDQVVLESLSPYLNIKQD